MGLFLRPRRSLMRLAAGEVTAGRAQPESVAAMGRGNIDDEPRIQTCCAGSGRGRLGCRTLQTHMKLGKELQ
jgi:hypothetical protein